MRFSKRYKVALVGLLVGLLTGCNISTENEDPGIYALAFTPTGNRLVVGIGRIRATGPTIQVWDPQQLNTPPQTLSEQDAIFGLAISPDGQTLATIGKTGEVQLWNLAAPQAAPIRLAANSSFMYNVQFSPDGTWLASGGSKGPPDKPVHSLYLWEVHRPAAAPQHIEGAANNVKSVAYSPDGQWLAAAESDLTVHVWNRHQPKAAPLVLASPGGTIYLEHVAFSPNSHTLVATANKSRESTGASLDQVLIWDVRQPDSPPAMIDTRQCHIRALAFHPTKQMLALGCVESTTQLWDLRQPTEPPIVVTGGQEIIWGLAFSPDGHWLATGSDRGQLQLLDLQQPGATPTTIKVP